MIKNNRLIEMRTGVFVLILKKVKPLLELP